MIEITYEDWKKEAKKRYGSFDKVRFVCPVCGHIATAEDWQSAGADEGAIGFACVGRWNEKCRKAFGDHGREGPCDYTGGGLFKINPIHVLFPTEENGTYIRQTFDFADEPLEVKL